MGNGDMLPGALLVKIADAILGPEPAPRLEGVTERRASRGVSRSDR